MESNCCEKNNCGMPAKGPQGDSGRYMPPIYSGDILVSPIRDSLFMKIGNYAARPVAYVLLTVAAHLDRGIDKLVRVLDTKLSKK